MAVVAVVAALVALAASTSACAPSEADGETTSSPGGTPVATSATTSRPSSSTDSPSASTPVSSGQATTPAPVTAVTLSTRAYDFSEIGPIVEQFIDDRDLAGAGLVVVDRVDGIVHEQYWGIFGPDRISLIASAGKMLVAGVLMRLDDQGLLDIDAPVADAVEWGDGNPAVTPAQLLSNSSGLVGLLPNPAYAPYLCQFLARGGLEECGAAIFTTAEDDADVIAPDTEFRYGGGQWQVAGAIAEAVSGRSWADLVDETYGQPCGVDSLGFANHWTQFGSIGFIYPTEFDGDPGVLARTDNPNIEGGAYISVPDHARLLLMHLRDGRCGDVQVLSPGALARMYVDRVGEVYRAPSGYGMGWWVDRESGRLTDPGAYGATSWLDLEAGYGAYLAVEGGPGLAAMLYPLIDRAMRG